MSKKHPALAKAPKTLRQSLERIRDFMADKKQHAQTCSYRTSVGRLCVIGQFFTPEQHKWIQNEGMNTDNITHVTAQLGEDNLKAMTQLSVEQAQALQQIFDNSGRPLLARRVESVLTGRSDQISGTQFVL